MRSGKFGFLRTFSEGGGSGGSFPVIEGIHAAAGAFTDPEVTLPSGVTAGDRLVVIFAFDGRSTITIASGTGWTIADQSQASGSGHSAAILTKIADGDDALTIGISGEANRIIAYRISNAGQLYFAVSANNTSDMPTLAPAGGPDDYLWISAITRDGAVVATNPPENYSGLVTISSGGGGTNVAMSAASRELSTSSEKPGSFDISIGNGVNYTIAISSL